MFVAAGDVNGDGRADIVTGPGAGGGPHVRIFSGATGAVLGEYFAYNAAFTGGVHVAVGDVNGDGTADVITGPGAGGGPHVRGLQRRDQRRAAAVLRLQRGLHRRRVRGGRRRQRRRPRRRDHRRRRRRRSSRPRLQRRQRAPELQGFFAYDAAFTGGVRVAAGDFDGDGRADIITGPGPGGGPHVRAFDGDNLVAGGQLLRLQRQLHRRRVRGGARHAAAARPCGPPAPAAARAAISQSQLDLIVAAAIGQWDSASPALPASCAASTCRWPTCPARLLGLAYPDLVLIDSDAAGHGWFVDSTPDTSDDLDASSMDLLSAVAHELGHVLGLDDLDDDSLMDGELSVGVRRVEAVDAVFAEL